MSYTIRFIDKSETTITDEEYAKLAGKTGLVFVPSTRETINMSSISRIFETGSQETNDHRVGVLHDGSRVVRQFGEWMCDDGERNDAGYLTTRPDPRFYPEVAKDCVPSVKTYETKFAALPPSERKLAMCGGAVESRYLNPSNPTRISEIVGKEPEWCVTHSCFLVDCSCFDQKSEDAKELTAD